MLVAISILLVMLGMVMLKAMPFAGSAIFILGVALGLSADDEDPASLYRVVGVAVVLLLGVVLLA